MGTICGEPIFDHPETTGDLHAVAAGAGQLAFELLAQEPAALPLEVRDSLDALVDRLAVLPGGNESLCAVACEAAYLVAAMVQPTGGIPLAPGDLSDLTVGLLAQLRALGLMDPFYLAGDRFGVWPEPAPAV